MLICKYYSVLIYLTFFLTFFFIGCSKVEKKILPEEKFIEILTDVMIVDNLAIPQHEKLALLQTLFKKHEITAEQFSFTKQHYKENADFWIRVYQNVRNRIKEKQTL